MAIEVNCPGCDVRLRVGDEHAGRPARCPRCSTIYTVPGPDTPSEPAADVQWRMKTPEGHEYGPVPLRELKQWALEGRVSHDCLLRSDQDSDWLPADRQFPELAPLAQPLPGRPTITAPATPNSPGLSGNFVRPHRGGLVLMMGLAAWFITCPVFSVLAWIMGSSDLRDMESGAMDSSGRSLTQAGYYLGMIHGILFLFALAFALLSLFIALLANL